VRRTLRAVRLLARDGELPPWLRGLAAVGLAPIPGPFDEAVLLVAAAILWLGYRDRLRAAWLASNLEGAGFDDREDTERSGHRQRDDHQSEHERLPE
jgi:hypothetical protein